MGYSFQIQKSGAWRFTASPLLYVKIGKGGENAGDMQPTFSNFMPMFKLILWTILIYLLVRFIFNFVIPVARTARQMKKQMRDFQNRMNEQNGFQEYSTNHGSSSQASATSQKSPEKPRAEDYIDFEEVK